MSGYTYTLITAPDGGSALGASGIDDAGTIIGSYYSASSVEVAFAYNDGIFPTIADPSASAGTTSANGISSSGAIAGDYQTGDDVYVGFTYVDGTYTDVTDPSAGTADGEGTFIDGINDAGDLWGSYVTDGGDQPDFVDIGGTFTTITSPYTDTDFVTIAGITADGVVVGTYDDENGTSQGFTWSNGTYTTISDSSAADGTTITSVNANGTIGGYYTTSSDTSVGFTYANGTFTDVVDPSAGSGNNAGTTVTGINASGEVVGYFQTDGDASNYTAEAFVDDDGTFTTIDDTSLPAISDEGITPPTMTINDSGDVLENYQDNDDHGVTVLVEPACYYPGTMIATPAGERAIETLAIGDLVLTADGRSLAVRWIGRNTVSTRFADPLRVLPIRIRAGALAENRPARDLLVSPDHAILVEDILVQAGALVNGTSIRRERAVPETFTYYHIECAEHALVLAEGTPAETFVDNIDRMGFDNWAEHEALYGGAPSIVEMPYPRAQSHRQVPPRVRAMVMPVAAPIAAGGPTASARRRVA